MKHSLKFFVFCSALFLLIPNFSIAQTTPNPIQALQDERVFIYGIDNRRTHIRNHNALIYGIYAGYSFGHHLRFKIAVSGTPFERGKFVDAQGLLLKQRLLFFSLGEEFDFLVIRRFRLTTYAQMGFGLNYFRSLDAAMNEVERGRKLILPLELGIHAGYDLNSWLQLKLGGGWRFVMPSMSRDLSGYYLKIALGFSGPKFWRQHGQKILNRDNMKP